MAKKLNILLVGYAVKDAEHIRETLEAGGLYFELECVTTADAFPKVLVECPWDIILSDDSMPDLGAERVLFYLAMHHLAIPVIVVSSQGNDKPASHYMKAGAQDFILISCMVRLVPAVQRSLKQMETLRHFRETQLALQKSEALFRAIASNLPGLVFQFLLNEKWLQKFFLRERGDL